ncbi:SCO6880 family protein [Microlunatus flavus]|uniref:PrgI family protein n=1 Tax=Microlunatus flavus TaxID=1036181 RepID=A0A1H9MVF9_9ACTN|nr:SCO6880 family protein [Microlunatus flavus]SER27696.1 hypothetical protein SAMN05421756_11197 [Microlunatus flavus]
MTGRVYRDYQRDRVGWFFGLTGLQLGLLAAGALPTCWAARTGWWAGAFAGLLGWVGLLALVVVPVRGRSAVGWTVASATFLALRLAGATTWRSGLATGLAGPAGAPDLPPPLDQLLIHQVAARESSGMVGVVQDRAARSWALAARITHGDLGWLTGAERDVRGDGLAALLDTACRTELVSELQLLIRACPDDGAERERWLHDGREPSAPTPGVFPADAAELARTVHDGLRRHLTPAARYSEAFLVLVVPDARLRKQARRGRSVRGAKNRQDDQLSLLAAAAAEVGQQASARCGIELVDWLDASGLAQACRTGYHPDSHAVLVDARPRTGEEQTEVGVPWAAAGPAHTNTAPLSYAHDAWESASVSVLLPARGATLGALAPVLSGGTVGERRCLLVAYPVITATVADRVTASREWAADLGDGLRTRAGVRPRAKTRADQATARGVDAKLVAGAALVRPYAIATTTVPATPLTSVSDPSRTDQVRIGDAVRSLEASVRRAGFAAQRLDLAHDTAFATGCIPLGHTLERAGGAR